MRRPLLAFAATAALVIGLVLVAARYDRPPATPGAWLARSGLEARFLTVGGHRLRYVRAGDGPAVVLVHGFASSLYTWKDVLPALVPAALFCLRAFLEETRLPGLPVLATVVALQALFWWGQRWAEAGMSIYQPVNWTTLAAMTAFWLAAQVARRRAAATA